MTLQRLVPLVVASLTLLAAPAMADENRAADKDRVIRPNDELTVSVNGLDGPNRVTALKRVVDDKGEIKLPQVKEPLKTKGLTCRKLEEAVDKAYRDAKLIETADAKVVFTKELEP
jgi:protein involved in polysaccharide export with SLBB domain